MIRYVPSVTSLDRQLENAQHGRNSLWTSLLRVRKAHFDEREKLKDYEERFERGFSRVLLYVLAKQFSIFARMPAHRIFLFNIFTQKLFVLVYLPGTSVNLDYVRTWISSC